ncbi:hypothetical protein SERLA73DRAFT_79171 [Serpula lacrymans var. lacrymans S7.3]|uniref:Uncharacterized protein n=1 Tax=Serpula lacrymans var. lacrymans (strain S7.3) TaxID=936435 RepID=F8QFI2_SERL3|nr:hypothetical protein SERLA73DRAFT_79171 [Serpula lacrymans var. lacrymans S7.3]
MLKRSRPVSPPPTSLPIFAPDDPMLPFKRDMREEDIYGSRMKRKRLGPDLSGVSTNSRSGSGGVESDGEEWLEDPAGPSQGDPSSDTGVVTRDEGVSQSYKQANSILREIHVLSHHRQIFSSSSSVASGSTFNAYSSPPTSHSNSPEKTSIYLQPPGFFSSSGAYFPNTYPSSSLHSSPSAFGEKSEGHEVQSVTKRYENQNKCAYSF